MFPPPFSYMTAVVAAVACLSQTNFPWSNSQSYQSHGNAIIPDIISIQREIEGTWKLISYELRIHGPWTMTRHPLGKDATGLILYTSDGYMSAQMMMPGAPAFTSRSYHDGSPEELASAAKHYLAYSGAYSVEIGADMKTLVRHKVKVSLYPNWLSTNQTRVCKLEDGELTLSPIELFTWNVSHCMNQCMTSN